MDETVSKLSGDRIQSVLSYAARPPVIPGVVVSRLAARPREYGAEVAARDRSGGQAGGHQGD